MRLILKFTTHIIAFLPKINRLIGHTLSNFSPQGINIDYFNQNVLRKDADQTITGKWTLHNAEILDDLKLETLNGYNLKTELITLETSKANVTGHKIIDELQVRNIKCPDVCVIHDVNVVEWFMNAIRNNRNHTIQGVTYLQNPIVYGNIKVLGYVNDSTFDANTFLLKSTDQVIKSDVTVQTKFPKKRKIYPSMFESLYLKSVNEINVNKFFDNVARYSDSRNSPNGIEINSKLKFKKPLVVQHLQSNENKLYGVNISQIQSEMDYGHKLNDFETNLQSLHFVGNALIEDLHSK